VGVLRVLYPVVLHTQRARAVIGPSLFIAISHPSKHPGAPSHALDPDGHLPDIRLHHLPAWPTRLQ